ncbi:uncharacterized protein LOC119770323 [Culex quinquefasciatus]|uniref:uncharacterized protein LOC119768675 n=1 Tax=Culex quinquefasciatus TaxID=7176 RepID=UPI0018E37AB6|nr:uncharacterized protein LOC119768675 [Culex quinquefasciatus]XP_038120754.1 uncharacterized protein LOC119770272 [Culex quinquefasciatus]XP_038120916.1 uncharacterized protein LOC119770323 [Culex quinquefasciatus]XP_039439553.1 uncharacterized protein LOC120420549 [Culex pipiens pallens]
MLNKLGLPETIFVGCGQSLGLGQFSSNLKGEELTVRWALHSSYENGRPSTESNYHRLESGQQQGQNPRFRNPPKIARIWNAIREKIVKVSTLVGEQDSDCPQNPDDVLSKG